MNMASFADNPDFVQSERLLMRLHDLIARGEGDSDEADAVREEMEAPERRLSPEELARLEGLSADLYMLQDEEIFERTTRSQEELSRALQHAFQSSDWGGILSLLRKGAGSWTRGQLAFMRARFYAYLGHHDAALRFAEYAIRLEPDNMVYVSLAAAILLEPTIGRADEEVRPLLQRAVSLIQGFFQRAGPRARPSVIAGDEVSLYHLLGVCEERLGHPEAAMQAYDAAIAIDPADDKALAARGLLRLASDPKGAAADFEISANNNTPLVWPYLYLAQQALSNGNYEKCKYLSIKALECLGSYERAIPGQSAMEADLLEWLAIAHANTGSPSDRVRGYFDAALARNPFDERIRENLRLFESWLDSGGPCPGAFQVSSTLQPEVARRQLYRFLAPRSAA